MELYHYDPETKEPTIVTEARLDPLATKMTGEDVYLIPAHATTEAPPAAKNNMVRQFISGKWKENVDHRGTEYYMPGETKPRMIMKAGVEIPKSSSPNPPKEEILRVKWAEIKSIRAQKIEASLEHAGNVFQVDRYSRESMEEAIKEMTKPANSGEKILWKLLDNSTVELSATQLENVLSKYRVRKHLLSQASWNAETSITALGNPIDVDARSIYEIEIAKLSSL